MKQYLLFFCLCLSERANERMRGESDTRELEFVVVVGVVVEDLERGKRLNFNASHTFYNSYRLLNTQDQKDL